MQQGLVNLQVFVILAIIVQKARPRHLHPLTNALWVNTVHLDLPVLKLAQLASINHL